MKIYIQGNMPIINEKGDWFDLSLPTDVHFNGPEALTLKRDRKVGAPEGVGKRKVKFNAGLIDLGVAMKLPKGFEAIVLPRSSTFGRYGIMLSNSMGIIDNSYCGPEDTWKFGAVAFKETYIPAGTRIAQFRIQLSQKATIFQRLKWLFSRNIKFVPVEKLEDRDRGGFGSTGV